MMKQRIKHLIAANGWRAALAEYDYERGEPRLLDQPLIGWVVVQANMARDQEVVEGLMAHPEPAGGVWRCEELKGTIQAHSPTYEFLGYVGPGQDVGDYYHEAREAHGVWRKKVQRERETRQ